ncbi:MAG: MAPEG family protein [Sulfitobacter sp.]|jgi:uncharacterized MAPEG superfamily protein|nr:MAPEG family protein [Sulfitobacter sp.]
MDQFDAYGHAIASLSLWGMMIVVLSMLSTRHRTDAQRCDCGKPKRDYSSPVYRRERAFMNAVEMAPAFVAVTVAAMLAGGTPFVVNLFASVFVVSRIVMAVIHIGTENQPMRSLAFVVGILCIFILGGSAMRAVFF